MLLVREMIVAIVAVDSDYELIIVQHTLDLLGNDYRMMMTTTTTTKTTSTSTRLIVMMMMTVFVLWWYNNNYYYYYPTAKSGICRMERLYVVECLIRHVVDLKDVSINDCKLIMKYSYSSESSTHIFTLYPCTSCFPRGREGV